MLECARVHMQTDPEATRRFPQLFLSSMTTAWFWGQESCPTSVSSLLPNDKAPYCPFGSLWAQVLQSSSSCTFCRDIVQGRWFPLLTCYSVGGNGKTDGREPQKHTNHQHQYTGRCVLLGGFSWCLHLAFLFVKDHLLACCVFLRLKCAQCFLHNLLWIVPSTNIELWNLLFEPGILATSHTYFSKTQILKIERQALGNWWGKKQETRFKTKYKLLR